MKRFFWAAAAAVVVAGAAPGVASAQFAGGPAVPAVPQPAIPGAAAPAGIGAAGPRVGFFQRAKQNFGNCIQNLLGSPLGQLLNNLTKPLSALTGGVIPTLEKPPSAEDTKQPGAAGAASLAKKDAAEAAKRRADVKYLGTLDCRYYPEATAVLAAALRSDPSECVRYEAALALARGCCCNQTTIKALTAAVSGYEEDGNPGERSARVRCTAAVALERCLACYVQSGGGADALKPDPDCGKKKEEKKEEDKGKEGTTKPKEGVSAPGNSPPTAKQVERAREVLSGFADAYSTTEAMHGAKAATGSRKTPGILEVWSSTPVAATTPAMTPASYVARTPAPAPVLPGRTTDTVTARVPDAPAPSLNRVKFKPEAETAPATEVTAPPVTGPVVPAVETTAPAVDAKPAEAVADPDAKMVEELVHKVLLSESAADQHAAIRKLVKYDWTAHPLVASCLVAGAKSASTDAVRVDCIRHLAHLQMAHKDVLAALAELCSDTDPWVREEAGKACETLKK
jgi:hypothetical protein